MNSLNITRHPIDRTALIAGIMFSFAGLAYLVDDHGLINVTEGAVAGTIVIVIGLVLLLAAVIDSPEVPVMATETVNPAADGADFSWASAEGPITFDHEADTDSFDTSEIERFDEAE